MKEITITVSQEQLNEMKRLLRLPEETLDKNVIEEFVEANLCMDKEGNSW